MFLVKGPLYLVSISATDEPAQALRKQLELLHGQVGPWFPSELTSTLLLLLGSESLRHLSCQTVCSVVLLLLLFIFKNYEPTSLSEDLYKDAHLHDCVSGSKCSFYISLHSAPGFLVLNIDFQWLEYTNRLPIFWTEGIVELWIPGATYFDKISGEMFCEKCKIWHAASSRKYRQHFCFTYPCL